MAVTGANGPVLSSTCSNCDEFVVYQQMWYDGAPHQGQCECCTTTVWHMEDTVSLEAGGVSFAALTSSP